MSARGTDIGRSTTAESLLLVRTTARTLEVSRSFGAARARVRQSPAELVVSVSATERAVDVDLEMATELLALRLGLENGDHQTLVEEVVSIGLASSIAAVLLRIAFRGSVVAVRLSPLEDPLEFGGQPTLEDLQDSFIANVRRLTSDGAPTNAAEFVEALSAQLDANSRRQLLATQSALTLSTRQAVAFRGRAEPDLLASLLEHRARLRIVLAANSDASTRRVLPSEFATAISDIDALTQFVLSRQTLDLGLAAEAEAKVERVQATEERARAFRLERLATALLVPALWLAFWSTKPAPEAHGTWGGLLVAGGAAALAAVFWWLPSRKPKENGQ